MAGGDGGPFRRVLVGWDGSPDSVTALVTAAAMIGAGAGHVVALAVLPDHPHLEGAPSATGDSGAAGRITENFARARAAITAGSRPRIDLHTEAGHQVARALCAYATEHGFDLLVLGRHGDGRMLRPRLGRVAEAAVKASEVPVLLVGGR